jgi:hypothetical protein
MSEYQVIIYMSCTGLPKTGYVTLPPAPTTPVYRAPLALLLLCNRVYLQYASMRQLGSPSETCVTCHITCPSFRLPKVYILLVSR